MMRNIKLLNSFLWGVNGLLGVGILAFAWFFLLSPMDATSLKDYRWDDQAYAAPSEGPIPGDDSILKSLRNPIQREVAPTSPTIAPSLFKAILKGTLPSEKDPKGGIAFIKSTSRNTDLVTFVGEEIRESGKPYEEFRGWTLTEVGKYQAIFSNGTRSETLSAFQESPSSKPSPNGGAGPVSPEVGQKVNRIGQAYQSTSFKSQLLASTDNRIVWGLDLEEIEWAMQNQDSIMDQAFQVSPSASGGIRLDRVQTGSIGAARGVLTGDIIREVNGQPLNSVADVKTLMSTQAMRAQSGMRISIERAGKPVSIEYRPLPK